MLPPELQRQLDTLWRMESPRLVARIAHATPPEQVAAAIRKHLNPT